MKTLKDVPSTVHRAAAGLRDGLVDLLGADLAAVWLYGAPLFGPHFLDIDAHVLLRRSPTPQEGRGIPDLHERIERSLPGGAELDTWYILLEDARLASPPPNVGPWNPGLRDGHWPLHRAHWLAGAVVVVHGLSPSQVVPAPTWEELAATLRAEAAEAADHLGRGTAYWTLQLCRVLASLETHDVVRSKLDSGEWALRRLPRRTHAIIRAAGRFYTGEARADDQHLIAQSFAGFHQAVRPLIDRALAK